MPMPPILEPDYVVNARQFARNIDEYKFIKGYGKFTSGDIKMVPGQVKSFGVRGQGTTGGQGFMFPVEDP